MIKLGFYFKAALGNIIHNKLLGAAKLLTSFFCMTVILFLIGAYGGGLAFVRERCNFRNISELKMYVTEDINILPKNPNDAEHFIFYARNNRVTFGSKYLAGVGIALTDLEFAELFENFFREGKYISDMESECVIGYEIAEKYKINISDKITVGSKKYKVCGISRNAGYRNTILLCDPRELEIGCPQIFISTRKLYGSGVLYEGENIQNYFGSMSDVSDLIPIIAACAVMLFFSAVNIFSIMVIYAKKSALRVQILRSLGASKKAIFAVRFIENALINITSFAVALALLISLKGIAVIVFSTSLEFTFSGILLAFLISVILSMIYSFKRSKREAVCIL